MAEKLSTSVFTREDTSSLPTTVTQFNGSKTEMLGQSIVTPSPGPEWQNLLE